MKNNFLTLILAFISFFQFVFQQPLSAQVYPSGFSQVLVSNGIASPTVFSFAPDGRIFVAQQNGQLKVIKNGVLLPSPFVSLSVNSSGERGLLGIAFDPNFVTNQFIYLYYTLSSAANNRISRFTANGDVALAGSELVLLNLDPLSSATNHNGGTMQFGIDGKLYVGIGENANTSYSQNLDTYHGKILRLNTDGTAPADNPYISSTNVKRQRVWAYGLRNPYTLSVQPVTGRILVNDVGQNTWEEINDATTGGKNFGWPTAEGTTNGAFTDPVYAYSHSSGCAITGGTFFNPTSTNYPSSYIGQYFYLDYCNRWIDALTLSGSTATRAGFATSIAGSPVNMATGPDGNLYFLSRSSSGLFKITYAPPTAPPTITTQPQNQSIAVGNPITFSVAATGSQTLFYQWAKGGVNIQGATASSYTIPSVSGTDAGSFSVVVSYGPGTPSTTSNAAILTVTQPNQKPAATISTPTVQSKYGGGQVISYSGSGSDPETGALPGTALSWYVDFHHDTHIHPAMQPTIGASGTFTVPTSGETATNVWFRFYLVATDPQGIKDTTFRDVFPMLSSLTFNAQPQGLQVVLDGQLFATPITITSVQGVQRNIGALSPQGNYSFASWAHGGANYQTITTPTITTTYTVNFDLSPALVLTPVADAYVHSGPSANTKFGYSITLITKTTTESAWKRETLIRFDISGFTATLGSAKLRLFGGLSDKNNASIQVEVHDVPTNTWTEAAVTWNTKPTHNVTIEAVKSVVGIVKTYYEWDLTSYINAQKAAGKTTINLKLINTGNNKSRIDFNSRENPANRPQLVLTPSSALARTNLDGELQEVSQMMESIFLYPNPASGSIYLDLNELKGDAVVQILDVSGKLVLKKEFEADKILDLDVSKFTKGIYLLHLNMNGIPATRRFVVE